MASCYQMAQAIWQAVRNGRRADREWRDPTKYYVAAGVLQAKIAKREDQYAIEMAKRDRTIKNLEEENRDLCEELAWYEDRYGLYHE